MKGQCVIGSATLRGVRAVPVAVEVAVSAGLPGMSIVGMPDVAVQEARERVRAALRATGFSMPNEKIVVNLAPGNVRKSGSGFDLPIAIGILVATGQIRESHALHRLYVGELSLEGGVRAVPGMLAFGMTAQELGCALVGAADCGRVPIEGLVQLGLVTLGRLHLDDPFVEPRDLPVAGSRALDQMPDYGEVAGQEVAKRAFQIAAAGGHGLLMSGPPGSGKTMLASRFASILPPLTQEEMLETAVVHSVAAEDVTGILAGVRPFRHPHHSATIAGLVGGGSPIRPGEVSLAHNGVLFLDELAEFRASVLQSLRQPMESGSVCLTRADGNVVFPAKFMLVAATNPCPCGYYGDPERECTCGLAQIRQYQGKIGGPLLDRIDLQIDVKRVDPGSVLSSKRGRGSAELKEEVLKAREYARWRMLRADGESDRGKRFADARCAVEAAGLSESAREVLETSARCFAMSGRAVMSVLRVARSIADMEQAERVDSEHVAEALGFRLRVGAEGR